MERVGGKFENTFFGVLPCPVNGVVIYTVWHILKDWIEKSSKKYQWMDW